MGDPRICSERLCWRSRKLNACVYAFDHTYDFHDCITHLDIGHIPTGKRRLDTVLLDIPECYDGCLDARLTLNDTFMTYEPFCFVAWETWAI